MKKRHEIDGLRSIAVLPVILFHAGIGIFRGGFVGVDVFFVISGYLITSLILLEQQSGSFSLARFYERRARRILPALFLVMLICIPLSWALMSPAQMKFFSRSLIHVSLFTSNMFFGDNSGYFDMASSAKPLLHTWSLAIEEQFYLLFPLLLMLTAQWKRFHRVGMLIFLALLSLAVSYWMSEHDRGKAFYFFPARIWELLIGSLIAFYLLSRSHGEPLWRSNLLGAAGIGMLAIAICSYSENTPYPSLYALLPTIGAALIIIYATADTIVGKILCTRLLTSMGLISYSAYLWHYPIFSFLHIHGITDFSLSLSSALIALTLLLAYASWRYVEQPFRDAGRVPRKPLLYTFAAALCILVALGTAGRITKGYEQFYIAYRLSEQERDNYHFIQTHTPNHTIKYPLNNGSCNFATETMDAKFAARFDACYLKYGEAEIVLGDSHATNIYNALYQTRSYPFLVGLVKGGCRVYAKKADCQYQDFASFLTKNAEKVRRVMFHESGSHMITDYLGREDTKDIFVEGKKYSILYPAITEISDYLNGLSQYTDVIWLGPFVESRVDLEKTKALTAKGFVIPESSFRVFQTLETALRESLEKNTTHFQYVSLYDALAITPDFLKQGNCLTYRDLDHFSACGEVLIGARIKNALPAPATLTPTTE